MSGAIDVKTPWLSVIGIGDDGLEGIGRTATTAIAEARVLVGGERHLQKVATAGRECIRWSSPLTTTIARIQQHRGRRVCVLASGDPMCYGIGVTLIRYIDPAEMLIIPAPSAFSLACARLGWSLAETETLTLHGRPLALVNAYLQPGSRLLLLSHDGQTPARVAEILCERGFAMSRITVLEHMGGAQERIRTAAAARIDNNAFAGVADFNTVAVECIADPDGVLLARIPGLPDSAYQHDGQLTKREVRAVTLALLAPVSGQLLWDVGAGAGSVAIEWLRSARHSRAIAIEAKSSRVRLARANADALGVPMLTVVQGHAPQALQALAPPDAVFIGGGLTHKGVLESCWQALKREGRLVANAVTIDAERILLDWQHRYGGELSRLAVSRVSPLGQYRGWQPLRPVIQYAVQKR